MVRTRKALCLVLCGALLCGLLGCSGSDNDAPLDAGTDALPPVTFTHQDLLNACVRLGACGIQRHPRLRDCLDNYYNVLAQNGQLELYKRLYTCANQGQGDCAKIRTCLGFATRPTNPKLKCDNTYTPRCVGNVAHSCDLIVGGWEQKLDCSKGGLTCAVAEVGSGQKKAICGAGTCDKSKYKNQCINNQAYSCLGGAIQINDCPSQGLQCRDPITGQCEGTGVSCKDMNPLCKGSKLVSCKGGFLWEVDCAKLPGKKTCDSNSNTCKGTGKACDPDTVFDSCDGDKLNSCIDGDNVKFDCKAMGFRGCKKADTGYGAYCDAEPVYD